LGHAPHEAINLVRALAAGLADDGLHFADGLLLRKVAHRARVDQDHIGQVLGRDEGVALGDELRGDGFAVALIHLAPKRLDKNCRHDPKVAGTLREEMRLGKGEDVSNPLP
jgi:hypothetical protein